MTFPLLLVWPFRLVCASERLSVVWSRAGAEAPADTERSGGSNTLVVALASAGGAFALLALVAAVKLGRRSSKAQRQRMPVSGVVTSAVLEPSVSGVVD